MKRFHYAAQEAQHRIAPKDDLFDVCSRKHGGNQESAEAHKTILGGKAAQRERVYEAIKQTGNYGRTLDELAQWWAVGPNSISGRFSELARDGRIVRIGRRPTRSGCSAAVWKAKV